MSFIYELLAVKIEFTATAKEKAGMKKVYMHFTCLFVVDSLKGLQITNPLYEI